MDEIEELDLFVWSDEDLAKPLAESPQFDYKKSIGNNFKKIKEKDKKFNTELQSLQQENIELKKTQDDMIEKSLNKETEADTSLIVKDTDEFYGKLSVYGGQRQEKREGYNKLETKNRLGSTTNGIDFVVNDDGTVTANGTATAVATYDITTADLPVGIVGNGLKRILKTISGSYTGTVRHISFDTAWGSGVNANIDTSFTLGSGTTYTYFRISINAGTVCNNLKMGYMVVEDDTLPYEQYGAMPSLNYPSEIECVGDNVNCLDFQNYQKFTSTATYYAIRANAFNLKANETYIYDYEASGDFSRSNNIKLWFRDYNNTVFKDALANKTFTLSNEELNKLSYIQVCIQTITAGTTYEGHIYPKIVKRDRVGAYSKYGQGSVEISTSNKSIYDTSKFSQGFWNVTSNAGVTGWLGKVQKGQKIIVKKNNNNLSYVIGLTTLDYRDSSNVRIAESGWQSGGKFEMIATEESYLFLQIRKNNNFNITSAELLTDDFEIYCVRKTHIMPIQQAMFSNDTFEKKDDGWYEKHTYKMVGLTGDENFSDIYNTNAPNPYQTWALATQNVASTWSNMYGIRCTHLTKILGDDSMNKNKIGICSDNNNLLFCVPFLTVEEFKTYLSEQYSANTPLKVAYRLKNAEYIKCTDEQSKILDKIDTYKDTTIITTDNDLCKISLRYKQSLEAAIKEYTATNVAESE